MGNAIALKGGFQVDVSQQNFANMIDCALNELSSTLLIRPLKTD